MNLKHFNFLVCQKTGPGRFFLFCILLLFQLHFLQAQPAGYYDSAAGKTGESLKTALHSIINGHTRFPYTSSSTDVWDILKNIDEDPANPENVILVYTGRSQDKDLNSSVNSSNPDYWNREHTWPKSHGFPNESDTAYTDVHHLRPEDASVNSSRSDKDFGNGGVAHSEATECNYTSTTWEVRDEMKGDIARSMFYMTTRYESAADYDLELRELIPTSGPALGILSDLLQWHQNDPLSATETARNEKIYTQYQHNRNPFIDHPEWVAEIWGSYGDKNEPTAHPLNLQITANGSNINLTWDDAWGTVHPDGYLVMASNVSFAAIETPADGLVYSDDASLVGGTARLNISQTVQLAEFTDAVSGQAYYFKLYPYTNSGSTRDNKTGGAVLQGSVGSAGGSEIVHEESFDSGTSGQWTTYSSASNKNWLAVTDGGAAASSGAMSINGYAGDVASNDWLISPALNLTNYTDLLVDFYTWRRYTGPDIDLLVSLNYQGSGNPAAATWTSLNPTRPASEQVWTAQSLSLDAYAGQPQVWLAFHYTSTGTASGQAAWWKADQISITGTDHSLPVFLQNFRITQTEEGFLLQWQTASEINNAGFLIWRRAEAETDFIEIANYRESDGLRGRGNSSSGADYEFWDSYLSPAGARVDYQLGQVDIDGTVRIIAAESISGINQPQTRQAQLYPVYPNPFNGSTRIRFFLPEAGNVNFELIDLTGRRILDESLYFSQAGEFQYLFNLSDYSSGTYILSLRSRQFTQSQRLVLIR